MKLLRILLICNLSFFCAYAQEPQVLNTKNKQEINLTPQLEKVLKKFNPRFKKYKMEDYILSVRKMYQNPSPSEQNELPMAVSGDFNADGKLDIALMGYDGVNTIYLLLVSEGTSYKPITIKKETYLYPKSLKVETDVRDPEYGLDKYISILRKKDVIFQKGSKFKQRDFIQLETYQGETKAYFYRDGKVIEYKGQQL